MPRNSWEKPEATSKLRKHHKEQTAQKQGRKSLSRGWVTAEQAQRETGHPNPERLERAQKTPLCLRGKGAVYLCPQLLCPILKRFTDLFNKPS